LSRPSVCKLEACQHLLLLRVATAHRGQLETGLHPHQELAPRERFDQEVVGAGFEPRDRFVLTGGARHQDQRNVLGLAIGAQQPGQVDAAEPWHLHVGDHQIERCRSRGVARDVAPLGGGHCPPCAQQELQRCARFWIVLDDEDARLELLCARHARQL
jgi:hypothetical protein